MSPRLSQRSRGRRLCNGSRRRRRLLGATCLLQGDLAEARIHLERTVADHAPDRDGEARFRFGIDTRAGALAYLALTSWHLGEVERARLSIEQAIRLGAELGHPT